MSTSRLYGLLLQNDTELLKQLRFSVQLTSRDFPDNGALWEAICKVADDGSAVTPSTVAEFARVPEEPLKQAVDDAFSFSANEALSIARKWVERTEIGRVGGIYATASAEIQAGRPIDEVNRDVIRKIGRRRGVLMNDPSTKSIRDGVDLKRKNKQYTAITRTMINWLDNILNGGLRGKTILAIGARQKGRKTSLARNICLGATKRLIKGKWQANDKVSIAFMGFENPREATYFDFVAQLAAERIRELGLYDEEITINGQQVFAHTKLDGEKIQSAYERDGLSSIDPVTKDPRWPVHLQQAIAYAMDLLDNLPIYIYDKSAKNGNLKTIESLRVAVWAHKYEHVKPGQHFVIVVDYAQLAKELGDDYKDMAALSELLLELAQDEELDCSIVVLSQFNEAGNWEKANEKRGQAQKLDVVPTKGGGDLAATVQNYITLAYDSQNPRFLRAELARSRRSSWSSITFEIHPSSGQILDEVPQFGK